MTRVKRGVTAHRRHRKTVKAAKGYRGLRSKTFKQAKNALMKAGTHSYTHRRLRKRSFRRLWIARINAACRPMGITYSRLIAAMTDKAVILNRKMMADMAVNEPIAFEAFVSEIKA
ncbi:50S ribosomal protein L20 [Patescibacteria group bacterium]